MSAPVTVTLSSSVIVVPLLDIVLPLTLISPKLPPLAVSSAAGAQLLPLYFNTCPLVTPLVLTSVNPSSAVALPPVTVIVFTAPVPVAVMLAPTKFSVVAAVANALPSS